jgi:alpha-soluble NSF attachment protein
MSDEAKGKQYLEEAEKKLKSSGSMFSSIFGSGGSKLDDAAELFQKAGNSFKMAKNWTAAGRAFCQAAEIQLKQNTKHEAANMYNEAANAFKKASPEDALNCLNKSCEIYIDMGRLVMAAKQYQIIAELFETDVVDIPNAITYYEKAADLFKTEENNASANKCLLKVAQFSAQLDKYARAIEIYEQIGTSSIESPLLKYGARDHFFRAALCHLCIDHLNCQQAIARYESILASFVDSRESNFLKQLISAVEENNLDNFTNAVKEYDSLSRLDNWCTTLLLRVKKSISEEPDLK